MKNLTFLLLFSVSATYGSDSLMLGKTFPKIETKILRDTLLDIRGTAIDTFGFIPDIIFIVRDWNGRILSPGYHSRPLLVDGTSIYLAGYGDHLATASAIQLNRNFYLANTYLMRFPDKYFRQEMDTIDFKTPVEPDVLHGKTCIYEIQLGRDEYYSECIVKTTKRFSKKDMALIDQIFANQDLEGVLESERGSQFGRALDDQIDSSNRKERTVWCSCQTRIIRS